MKKIVFLFLFISNTAFAQVNLTQGLMAYYPFTGNANDISGNNNNPIFNNATLTTDRLGNANSAYHFDGVSTYMQIPNSPSINFSNQISICAWIKPTGFYYGLCHGNAVLMKGDFSDAGFYVINFDDNEYTNGNNCNGGLPDTLHETIGGPGAPETTPYTIKNQWYSIVYTNDGTTAKLYTNCKLTASYPSSFASYTNSYDLVFGRESNPSFVNTFPFWFNGDLDEVRLYNRPLNQDEVNAYGGCTPLCSPTYVSFDTTICQGQSYAGYNTSGTYLNTLTNSAGCDSIRTINLTVQNCACPSLNNLNITTGYNPTAQTSTPIGQKDSSWIVTAMSSDMQNAFSNNNTNGHAPPAAGAGSPPVNIGQPAWVIQSFPPPWVQSDTYLSCFPFNTMFTVVPAQVNVTNCTMDITRNFCINSNTNENVNLNFSVSSDDYTVSVTLDAGTANPITLATNGSLTPELTINSTQNLAPGKHTITISTANAEDPNGVFYTLPTGNQGQWNPFGVAVTGNITSANNVLQNNCCCTATNGNIDTTICQGQSYLGHTTSGKYIDTLINAAGCDSIRTINLTVVNCNCKSSFEFTRASNSIVNITSNATGSTGQLYSTNGFTWEGWVKLTAPITNKSLIISTEDAIIYQDIFLGFGWGATPNALSFVISDNGAANATIAVESFQNFTVNTWYHIAAVCDYTDAQLLLYLNGNLIATQTIPANILNNRLNSNHLVQIGNASAAANGIDADIDEVRFWSTARTQAQIQSAMSQCMILPQTGLIAYFKADENNGTSTKSAVDDNFVGTLINTNWSTQVPAINCSDVIISDSATSCNSFDFKGLAYIAGSSIKSWKWIFDDGGFANTQNTSHSFSVQGNHLVKLIITGINGCLDSTTITVAASPAINIDFSYTQDVCTPLSVQFHIAGNDSLNPFFSFGDGSVINGNTNPIHTYAVVGNYIVKYAVENEYGCTDTIVKTIPVITIPSDIILTPDTTICYGNTKQLRTKPALGFCWSPATYLDDPTLANPTTSAPKKITYYFNAEIQGNNIISNGDFSLGNQGFTSQYINTPPPNTAAAQYFIGTDPHAWNPGMSSSCVGHNGTSANGNEMLVNGAPIPNVIVWSETIPVTPNTNYAFSAWAQNLAPSNYINSSLQFSINGNLIGNVFNTNQNECIWDQFYSTWNSGNATSAIISIVNNTLIASGNDFALDDISFSPVYIEQDSVIINVDTPSIKINKDTTICSGSSAPLNASGSINYSWLPVTGLSIPSNIANPIATPTSTTTYTVTGTDNNSCSTTGSVTITVSNSAINVDAGNDSTVCKNSAFTLHSTGTNIAEYAWAPKAFLNDSTKQNPTANIDTTTEFYLLVKNAAGCTGEDSVKITVYPLPNFTISPDLAVCTKAPVKLDASGGDTYLWSPAGLVSNPKIANPLTNDGATETYTVQITESTCNNSSILTTTVTLKPPLKIITSKSNDLDCSNGFAKLLATGAGFYTWSPGIGLNDSTIYNPVASLLTTQQYIVKGETIEGCIGYDTITVYANYAGNNSGYYMPNAFTPNGDGINDCYGIKYWGLIEKIDFTIYDRWGNKVFYTNNPAACWDGIYNGVPASAGGYVYYIKAITACGQVERKGSLLLIR